MNKNPAAKCHPPVGVEPSTSDFCMLLSELIPYLLEDSRHLNPYVAIFFWFQKIL